MTTELRMLRAEDLEQGWELDRQSFNSPPERKESWLRLAAREPAHGLFEGGRLAAMTIVIDCGQFFGGRSVPMGGLSSVAVAPEHRGKGYASRVVEAALRASRERGRAVSSLFPATTSLYRGMGWEVAGVFAHRIVPSRSLRDLPGPRDATVRRATDEDVPAMQRCYAGIARQVNGFVDRTESWWETLIERWRDRVVFVVPGADGEVDGYAVYRHQDAPPELHGAYFRINVDELHARNLEAFVALWRVVGSSSTQVDRVLYRGAAEDPLLLVLREQDLAVLGDVRWMLRAVDPAAAIEARGFPRGLEIEVQLELDDPQLPENSGAYVLSVSKGRGQLARGGSGSIRLDVGAFAPLYSGWASTATLARLGRVAGGTSEEYALLDAAFAGATPWIVDEF